MPDRDDRFKLPGSSYETLVRIIKAYNLMKAAVGPADVARPLGVDATIVSRNNGFLLSAGIVEGGNKKSLTTLGQALARALDFDVDDDVQSCWSAIVRNTDFLRELVEAVRIRGGMVPAALASHVAYSAGVSANSASRTGAGTVVEVLQSAGALTERDGKLVAEERVPVGSEETWSDDDPSLLASTPHTEPVSRENFSLRTTASADLPITIAINVSVECSVEDLPRLATQIEALQRALKQAAQAEEQTG